MFKNLLIYCKVLFVSSIIFSGSIFLINNSSFIFIFNIDINFTETFKMNLGFTVGINTLVNDLGRRNITYSLIFGTNF